MKRVIILILAILIFSPAYSIQNPFGKKKECPKIEKQKECYHRIKISPEKEYIFAGGCDVIKQIAVIFNSKKTKKILYLNQSQKVIRWSGFIGPNGLSDMKEKDFKNLLDIEFNNFNEKDYSDR